NLGAANAQEPALTLLLLLARYDFEHGRAAEGRQQLKDLLALTQRSVGRDGDFQRMQQAPRVAVEYVRSGHVAEVLDLLGLMADLPVSQQGWNRPDAANSFFA